ncbi:ankyrin repeat protein [Xylaria sp. FL0043]|nr:ankyrin repeat protein [Xylaria sp. FL0043]
MKWLSDIKYDSRHQESINSYQDGTGKWFLESQEYECWLRNEGQTLFCHGIPGGGKTIVTSAVIKELHYRRDNTIGIAYFYFSYDQKYHEREPLDIFRCLLKQLSEGLVPVPDVVKSFYNKHKGRTVPSLREVMETFQSVAKLYRRSFIVIDALDECPASEGHRMKFIKQIKEFQIQTRTNILLTSRDIPEIMDEFKQYPKLKIRASGDDVHMFLDKEIPHLDLQRLLKGDFELQQAIKTKICDTADGMFLLASLLLNLLDGATDKAEIRQRLEELPRGSDAYGDIYKSIMIHRIEKQKGTRPLLAKRALAWITCARASLTPRQLQHALSIQPKDRELNKDRVPELDTILSVCCGLVIVDKWYEWSSVRLVHLTAEEYFQESRENWFENADGDITAACITYLLFPKHSAEASCYTLRGSEENESLYPLYPYAARNWDEHARGALVLGQDVIEFLEDGEFIQISAQYTYYVRTKPLIGGNGLHLAAFFGLEKAMNVFLLQTPYMEVRDGNRRTPLSYAVEGGYESIVERLLQISNINPDSEDDCGRTPLSYAAENGYQSILLLDSGTVDANLADNKGITPLMSAAFAGETAIVQLLLDSGKVDVGYRDKEGRTALWTLSSGTLSMRTQRQYVAIVDGLPETHERW